MYIGSARNSLDSYIRLPCIRVQTQFSANIGGSGPVKWPLAPDSVEVATLMSLLAKTSLEPTEKEAA